MLLAHPKPRSIAMSITRITKASSANQSTIPDTGFLRLPEVLSLIPISATVWWEGVRTGRYPKGIKLSARTTAWRVEDIKALIQTLSEAA